MNQMQSITYDPKAKAIVIIHEKLGGVRVVKDGHVSTIRETDQKKYGSEIAAKMSGSRPSGRELETIRAALSEEARLRKEARQYMPPLSDAFSNSAYIHHGSETGRISTCTTCKGHKFFDDIPCPECGGDGIV